jgi:hypothetical protein
MWGLEEVQALHGLLTLKKEHVLQETKTNSRSHFFFPCLSRF